MSLSNFAEGAIATWISGGAQPSAISAVYVQLHTGDPGEDGTANVATESTRKEASFAAQSGGVVVTNADTAWTNVSTTETYSYASIWDAATGGNCLGSGALTESRAVVAGDNFTIESGDLSITIT